MCKLCKLALWIDVFARFLFGLVGSVAGCDYVQCVSSVQKDYYGRLSLSQAMYVYMKAAYLSMLPDSESRPFGDNEVDLFRYIHSHCIANTGADKAFMKKNKAFLYVGCVLV